MERLKVFFANAVFAIQFLILFILLFEDRIEVPAFLQAFGRVHPLMLHLPIGLLLVTVVLVYVRHHFEGKAVLELIALLLHITAITASITTLMGLFLSFEGSFGANQLFWHKWLGVALSFFCWALLAVQYNLKFLKPLGLAACVLLIFTGHYGANLTHGEDFVWAPLKNEPPPVVRVITDSTTLFAATVEPILESKCYGCHNEKKAKGNLILTSLEHIRKGGESGPLWMPENAAASLIVERMLLPLDHKEHMPPKDKAQLTDEEIGFISLWIERGANTDTKLKELAEGDTLQRLASAIVPRYQQFDVSAPKYSFAFVEPEKIEQLTIPNRTVFQIARNEPAVRADFFLSESYDRRHLEELLAVDEQLVTLNLSKMPVEDDDLKTIERFRNLEELNLNHTVVTGSRFDRLANLAKLRSLSVSGTRVSAEALHALGKSASLQEVFIWNTNVSDEDAKKLSETFPAIRWHIGYVADETEILKLNAPFLKKKGEVLGAAEKVALRHNLPGTIIRYSVDGSEPDSINSPVYKEPFEFGHFGIVKTKAFKEGWLSSDVTEFILFRQGYKPDSAILLAEPDEKYPGDGAATLVDGLKGLPNFYRHPAWMAFRERDLELQFAFLAQQPTIRNITLSFAHNKGAVCLPPEEMQLWGGNDAASLKLISKKKFAEGEPPAKARIEGVSMDVPASAFRYYKLVAKPGSTLADGNPKKRQLWLMVDEVFIN